MSTVRYSEFSSGDATPVAAYRRVRQRARCPAILLESAPGTSRSSRYSVVACGCIAEVRAAHGVATLTCGADRRRFAGSEALAAARELLRSTAARCAAPTSITRFLGAYGAAAYEFASYCERVPRLDGGEGEMPDLHLIVPESVVVFDHVAGRISVMTIDDARRKQAFAHEELVAAIASADLPPLAAESADAGASDPRLLPATLPFPRAFARAQEHIAAGDAYQIVLSQRWVCESAAEPLDVYRRLRELNPSPYMFALDFGWGELFGSSPEVLVRVDGRRALVRPLAGTRPRGADGADDIRTERGLRADPKERAEHVMLVDLGRNDLARSCEPGSVRVDAFLDVEHYSHVMHLVSEVSGDVRPGCDAFDVFAAAFPAGTVTGAPKIRAIELIAAIEGRRRGFYAGCVGYFGFDGSMDACITLRSALAVRGSYVLQAGAGIVADSDAETEDRECRAKAGALFAALALKAAVRA